MDCFYTDQSFEHASSAVGQHSNCGSSSISEKSYTQLNSSSWSCANNQRSGTLLYHHHQQAQNQLTALHEATATTDQAASDTAAAPSSSANIFNNFTVNERNTFWNYNIACYQRIYNDNPYGPSGHYGGAGGSGSSSSAAAAGVATVNDSPHLSVVAPISANVTAGMESSAHQNPQISGSFNHLNGSAPTSAASFDGGTTISGWLK